MFTKDELNDGSIEKIIEICEAHIEECNNR